MPDLEPPRGMLFLIVGPSGAGKDSLIDAARTALAGRGTHVFARRVISRPASAGGEDHVAVTPEDFLRLRAAGCFALAWQAHGLGYGIPREIGAELAAGRSVVANVSRTVVDEARARFQPVRIIAVTASPEVLAARLALRGRESAADIARRLARSADLVPSGEDLVVLRNDGALADAAARFVAALTAVSDGGD